MNSKKGMELSVNVLVIMILAIAMFGFGIYFTKQIFSQSTKLTEQLDEQTNARIEELLSDGSRVVIPFQTKTEKRGEVAVFGVGILNTLEKNAQFKIILLDGQTPPQETTDMYPALGYNKDGIALTPTELQAVNLLFNGDLIPVRNNDNHKFTIGAAIGDDAPSGKYVINFKIKATADDGNPSNVDYGESSIYKLYLVVP